MAHLLIVASVQSSFSNDYFQIIRFPKSKFQLQKYFFVTIDIPVKVTLSAIERCPATPHAPARIQFLPIFVLPAIPHFAAIAVFEPIWTLCAICTRLSIITPSSKIVLSSAPLSILQFDPIRTSFPIKTEPN